MIDPKITVEEFNKRNANSMGEALGIVFTEVGKDYLTATMPVDNRTQQPIGLLHGGASAALAETVGSTAAYACVDQSKYYTVGLEIKCNHIRSVREGTVTATARPLHIGRKTHVWQINILNEEKKLVCFSTLTMAVIEK
jgi:1,4-dihydroxy-2-naphthoyl-CoA hydrolase